MDLVERLREWRDDRREVDRVTMAGQHPNTELLSEAADRILALEEALREIIGLDSSSEDIDVTFDRALAIAEGALGQTVE